MNQLDKPEIFTNDEIFFFDCNISYGVATKPPLKQSITPGELLAEMDHCGIDEALVTCAMQRYSPSVGNAVLVEQIENQPRLHPVWALLPHQTGEIPEPVQLIDQMKANGVRALWAWPMEHHYLLDSVTFGSLFEEIIPRQIPLFFNLAHMGDTHPGWERVAALLKDFPDLTLIATDQSVWGEDHYIRPLVERYPNFYVETSHYELANGLKDFYKKYGADHWLFGTSYPKRYMGGAVMQLINTDIPRAARQSIAGRNLKNLLEAVKL
jgi:hypothetical protein